MVGVDETTLNIICTKDKRISLGLSSRGGGDSEHPLIDGTKYPEKKCFIGGRRWTQNQCPEQRQSIQPIEQFVKNIQIEPVTQIVQNVQNDFNKIAQPFLSFLDSAQKLNEIKFTHSIKIEKF